MNELVVGVLVGGQSRRMGGVAKGLLRAPDGTETVIERLCGEARAAVPGAPIVLVGDATPYSSLKLPVLDDDPPSVGPIGGLCALLRHESASHVLALACDLPRLTRATIARLAREHSGASALVVRQGEHRNPLIARYAVAAARPAAEHAIAAGKRSLQAVLDELGDGVVELELSEAERATLDDWDTPEDVARY